MDKNRVIKVDTFKSGRFAFSRNCSSAKLLELQVRAEVLYATVGDLPILPRLAAEFEEEIVRKAIFGTAAIEGNPLTEEQVKGILELSPKEAQQLEARAEREITNLVAAYKSLEEAETRDNRLTEGIIRRLHEQITEGIEHPTNEPGRYRSHKVKVSDAAHGGVYVPPKIHADIENLMREFVEWINSKEVMELTPAVRGALAHYHLCLIHPFGDGNGRTARIIEALIMSRAGIRYAPLMLSNFYYRNVDEYFWAFSKSIKSKEKDVTPFMEFVLRGLCESLGEIKDRIAAAIRLFAHKDLYAFLNKEREITKRQHDLLIILTHYLAPITLSDLYTKPYFRILYEAVSERTARRDLHKLHAMGLLTRKKDAYSLNVRHLG